ncbi:MAG: NAD(P)H-dependent oxidoreductase [Novosphingobium sp.]|nr:NAD(P)H-dependent oxidoreductase [Novosphingobium sp.]
MTKPFILGIGGTTRPGSSSELVLRAALKEIEAIGGETGILAGPDLVLALYAPENPERDPKAETLIELIRRADGVVIASPGYHGSISGMIKNALDYVEDTAKDPRPYLDGRAVGCIACAYGWQATGSTLIALRTIVHALRGWPTPLGVAANTTMKLFGEDGCCIDPGISGNLRVLAQQVMHFARLSACLETVE